MRAVRYLTLAVACLVTLVWVGAASALIVPQQSIAGVELKMTRPEVKDKKGDPDRIVHGTNDFGPYTQFIYKNAVGKLMATFQGNMGATGGLDEPRDAEDRRRRPRRLAGERAARRLSAAPLPHGELRLPPLLDGPLPRRPQGDGLPDRHRHREVKSVTVAFVID